MTIHIQLSDSLTNDLVHKATSLKVSIDDLVEQIVRHALKTEQIDSLISSLDNADRFVIENQDNLTASPTLSEIVAEIQSLPPSQPVRIPTDKSLDEILAELENRPVPDDEPSPEEWDRMWQRFEQEEKNLTLINDIVEGNI